MIFILSMDLEISEMVKFMQIETKRIRSGKNKGPIIYHLAAWSP
jgi:hypothetical protein